jgi:hypothetical protein
MLEDRAIVEVLCYYLDGFSLLSLGCVSHNLRDLVSWTGYPGGKEAFTHKHFHLRAFLGQVKEERYQIEKHSIAEFSVLSHAPHVLVEAIRDACDPAFHDPMVEDITVPLYLHDLTAKQSKAVSVPVIAEMAKKYGKITSYRHDPAGDYLYFTTRHFTPDGAQHEVVYRRTSAIDFETDVQYECLGRLELDDKRTNFPAGVDFAHVGEEHYLLGENYGTFVVVDLKTLKPMPGVPDFSAYGNYPRTVVVGSMLFLQQTSGKRKEEMPTCFYSIPDFRVVHEVGSKVQLYHPLQLYDDHVYNLEHGRVRDVTAEKEILCVEKLDPAKYIPYPSELLAVDHEHVLWCHFPTGDMFVVNRKSGNSKKIVSGTWKPKKCYNTMFAGGAIIWYDINKYDFHIISPQLGDAPIKKKKSFLKFF